MQGPLCLMESCRHIHSFHHMSNFQCRIGTHHQPSQHCHCFPSEGTTEEVMDTRRKCQPTNRGRNLAKLE